jgi:hypothetical protein
MVTTAIDEPLLIGADSPLIGLAYRGPNLPNQRMLPDLGPCPTERAD